jgi:tRNA 2-thiouridine synthesizing protein A
VSEIFEHILDERGHLCPLPVIALGHLWERLQLESGTHIITVVADDPVAVIDIPAWCNMKNAVLLSVTKSVDPTEPETREFRIAQS